jgi:hypothetical protein
MARTARRASRRSTVLHHQHTDTTPTTGTLPPAERTCAAPPPRLASADGSRRTSPGTPLALEPAREGVPLLGIQRQLGHSNLGITSIFLQGIDNAQIIDTVHARHAPTIPVSASLRI